MRFQKLQTSSLFELIRSSNSVDIVEVVSVVSTLKKKICKFSTRKILFQLFVFENRFCVLIYGIISCKLLLMTSNWAKVQLDLGSISFIDYNT